MTRRDLAASLYNWATFWAAGACSWISQEWAYQRAGEDMQAALDQAKGEEMRRGPMLGCVDCDWTGLDKDGELCSICGALVAARANISTTAQELARVNEGSAIATAHAAIADLHGFIRLVMRP